MDAPGVMHANTYTMNLTIQYSARNKVASVVFFSRIYKHVRIFYSKAVFSPPRKQTNICCAGSRPSQYPLATFLYQGIATVLHYLSVKRLQSIRDAKVLTTIAVSTDDYLVRPSNSRGIYAAMKAPWVRLHVFRHGGHAIIMEDVEGFNALLLDHLHSAVRASVGHITWPEERTESVVCGKNTKIGEVGASRL